VRAIRGYEDVISADDLADLSGEEIVGVVRQSRL
jgi:hypothetical protein